MNSVNFDRYRITVSKSLKNISAQIIDDKANKTIVSASSNEKKLRENKVKKNGNVKNNWRNFSQKSNRKKLQMFILIEVDLNTMEE